MLLDRHDYIDTLTSILSEQTKFSITPGEKDKTVSIEQQMSRSLKALRDEGVITGTAYDSTRPTGSTVERVYGLPKSINLVYHCVQSYP